MNQLPASSAPPASALCPGRPAKALLAKKTKSLDPLHWPFLHLPKFLLMLNRRVADKRVAGRRAPIGAELATGQAVLKSPFWQAVPTSQFWFALNSNLGRCILFEILRILFGWRTRPAQTPSPERSTRLQVEELEHRALPSVFGLLRAFQIHLADINGDVTRASDAVSALSTAVGLNAKPAVAADINTLTTDVGTLTADLAAGTNVSADISKLIGDQVRTE